MTNNYKNAETLTCKFSSVVQRDYNTGICTFKVIPIERNELQYADGSIYCKGNIVPYEQGTPLRLYGRKQGKNFSVLYTLVPTDTQDDIERFIHFTSKEFSQAQTDSIVKLVLDNNGRPYKNLFALVNDRNCGELLTQALSRSSKKEYLADLIIKKTRGIQENHIFHEKLSKYNIPYDRIWEMINNNVTLGKLEKYPYYYFSRYRVPIDLADTYAKSEAGFNDYSAQRLKSYVSETLKKITASGDTCATLEGLTVGVNRELRRAERLQGLNDDFRMSPSTIYCCVKQLQNFCSVKEVNGKSYIYVNNVWDEETSIIHHLNRLSRDRKRLKCKLNLNKVEKELGITYNEEQREAFNLLKSSGVKILTGPPGSGKTAILRGLIKVFQDNGLGTVALAATTGMAAKVMTEACGLKSDENAAKTMHIMLQVRPCKNGSIISRSLNDPVDADFIIIDETSMMDLQMFSAMAAATKNGSILLLVGDHNQLQSVGYGSVLNDLIESGMIETYRLTKVLRQSGNSISSNAQLINRGNANVIQDESFRIVECESDDEAKAILLDDIKHNSITNTTILSPVKKKGPVSVAELNSACQAMNTSINRNEYCEYGDRKYYVNDKIILQHNEYERGYVNGDTGYIASIQGKDLVAILGDGIRNLDWSDMKNIDLAYATTIHKSQGSESDNVCVVLPESGINMMTRRLLYTAVTRAKKKVIIYSVNHSFELAVKNEKEKRRNTLLRERVETALGKDKKKK